jgi:hypothetical protein
VDSLHAALDELYATDLVYVRDCWTMCGDAHCCSFARHKKRFTIMARQHFQELPLLHGEYEYMRERGWLEQFGEHEHKVVQLPLADGRVVRAESIVSRRAGCACNHATRPIVCRLYPLLPVFAPDGKLVGIEDFGVFEVLERIEHLEPACAIREIPVQQLGVFLGFCAVLARTPAWLFQLEAYRITKAHVAEGIAADKAKSGKDAFKLFEWGFLRDNLIRRAELAQHLAGLADAFSTRWGPDFVVP